MLPFDLLQKSDERPARTELKPFLALNQHGRLACEFRQIVFVGSFMRSEESENPA